MPRAYLSPNGRDSSSEKL